MSQEILKLTTQAPKGRLAGWSLPGMGASLPPRFWILLLSLAAAVAGAQPASPGLTLRVEADRVSVGRVGADQDLCGPSPADNGGDAFTGFGQGIFW